MCSSTWRSPTLVRASVRPIEFEIAFEPEVRHHGGDDAGPAQAAVVLPALGDDGHHLIAVHGVAEFVHQQNAIGVAVERDAHVRAHFAHLADERLRIGRADFAVDVEAVGLDADRYDFRAQLPQRFGRNLVARAMGAIDDDAQAVERQGARQRQLREFDVARAHVVDAPGAAQFSGLGELRARDRCRAASRSGARARRTACSRPARKS